MKKEIRYFIGCLNNFGIAKGLALFLKSAFVEPSRVALPNLRHPIHLRKKTSDFKAFCQVFIDREYAINFNAPKIVLDCGANIGLFAIHMKSKHPEATIICVEPDPENFEALKRNLAAYENVYFENCGIWSYNTKLKVYDKHNAGKWGIVVEEDLVAGTIPAVSIPSLMRKYNLACIDVLKLDIESSEKQLFSANYAEWLPKVRNLVIELHDFMLDGCSQSFFKAVSEVLTNYEFKTRGENVIISNKDLA